VCVCVCVCVSVCAVHDGGVVEHCRNWSSYVYQYICWHIFMYCCCVFIRMHCICMCMSNLWASQESFVVRVLAYVCTCVLYIYLYYCVCKCVLYTYVCTRIFNICMFVGMDVIFEHRRNRSIFLSFSLAHSLYLFIYLSIYLSIYLPLCIYSIELFDQPCVQL